MTRRSALAVAAQLASVSYRTALAPSVLADSLVRGAVPPEWAPHLHELLEEATVGLLQNIARELAESETLPTSQIWAYYRKLAHAVQSLRPLWTDRVALAQAERFT